MVHEKEENHSLFKRITLRDDFFTYKYAKNPRAS